MIFRVRLENAPGHHIEIVGDQFGVAREIAPELAEQREHEQVRHRPRHLRAVDDRDRRAIGGVDAFAPPVIPVLVLRVAGGESRAFQHGPRLLQPADDADLVAILQILADALQIDPRLDAERFHFLLRPDAGQHQKLRRVEGAAREDDFARGIGLLRRAGGLRRIVGGAIQPGAFEIGDADGAIALVEQHLCRQRIQFDFKPVGMAARDVEHEFARAVAGVAARGQWRVMNAKGILLDQPPVVGIALALEEPGDALPQAGQFPDHRPHRFGDDVDQFVVADRRFRNCFLGLQPAGKAVPARIETGQLIQPPHQEAMMEVFQPLEIAPHRLGAPGRIVH